jgi:hypothetical protein
MVVPARSREVIHNKTFPFYHKFLAKPVLSNPADDTKNKAVDKLKNSHVSESCRKANKILLNCAA